MKLEKSTDMIQIFPKKSTGDEWKTQEHKWCILITEKKTAESIKKHLEHFSKKRLIVIDGEEELEKFKGITGTIINKISACQVDGCTLSMNTLTHADIGLDVYFLYTGMTLEEVDKYYKEFLSRLRKMKKDKKKRELKSGKEDDKKKT